MPSKESLLETSELNFFIFKNLAIYSESSIERVLREVRAMAMLDHSGIIRYCHTWIERPPEGWQVLQLQKMGNFMYDLQKESDKAMLLRIQKNRKPIAEAFEPSISAVNETRYFLLIYVKEIHTKSNNAMQMGHLQ